MAQGYSDGYLYALISSRPRLMPRYGTRSTTSRPWMVVSYVRQLQGRAPETGDGGGREGATITASTCAVSESVRAKLQRPLPAGCGRRSWRRSSLRRGSC